MSGLVYHITNGDVLTERLQTLTIEGEILTMRECMIDGPKDTSQSWEVFFKSREGFVYEQFGRALSYDDYVLLQLRHMRDIPKDAVVYFWFEDDLFCQANFWFLLFYLRDVKVKKYWVRSGDASPYSFGHLSQDQLKEAMHSRIEVDKVSFARIWGCYATNDQACFREVKSDFDNDLPGIVTAFEAHIGRLPKENYLGKPKQVLQQICKDIGQANLEVVFKEFSRQMEIYGYGDIQVKNMLKELQ